MPPSLLPCAPAMPGRAARISTIPSSGRSRRANSKASGANGPSPNPAPCWERPTGRRRWPRALPASTWRWSACRWTSASPTAPAPAWGRAQCVPSSASARSSMSCGVRRCARCASPTPATYRSRAVTAWRAATPTSRRISVPSCRPASSRCRSAAITRSATRSCAPSAPRARSAWCMSMPIATHRRPMRARNSTTEARSGRRSSTGCWTPNAPCRSASAAVPNICGGSATSLA